MRNNYWGVAVNKNAGGSGDGGGSAGSTKIYGTSSSGEIRINGKLSTTGVVATVYTSVRDPVNSGTYLKMGYVFWSIWGTYFDYF